MDENYLRTLRILELEPSLSQRVLALRLNLSLGKTNSLLNSMINAGYIQAVRFRNSSNKRAYRYDITSEGLKCKLDLACRFLQVKARECEELKEEIESLKQEILETPIRTIRFTGLTECYSRK
jgi:EPS-associated MarR family transcriptional regulator